MTRIQSFLDNTDWLAEIVGNKPAAALSLIKLKLNKSALVTGRCGKNIFHFRKPDLSGVREILVAREYDFLKSAIESKPGFTILDCGAHIGLPILWALTVNPDVKVLSVEASPDTFHILEKNRAYTGANWNIINRACWSDESEIAFSTKGDSMSHRASVDGTMKMRGITLPELIDKISPDKNIDLAKIDIEGAEENFLCAYPEALNKIDRLVIELHPKLCDTTRVENLLKQYFNSIETIGGRTSSKPLLYCTKTL